MSDLVSEVQISDIRPRLPLDGGERLTFMAALTALECAFRIRVP
jgi:hypothetical protein